MEFGKCFTTYGIYCFLLDTETCLKWKGLFTRHNIVVDGILQHNLLFQEREGLWQLRWFIRPLLDSGIMFVLESTGCGFEVWYFEIDSFHTLHHHHQGSGGSIHTSASLISSLSSILSTVKHPWLMLSYMAGSSFISRASVIWVDRTMKPNIMASTTKGPSMESFPLRQRKIYCWLIHANWYICVYGIL